VKVTVSELVLVVDLVRFCGVPNGVPLSVSCTVMVLIRETFADRYW
jgi:hypothetical protein